MMAEILDLPDEILGLIAGEVVGKKVVGEEDGLRLWCKFSSTCRRLSDFQLPSEPAYLLEYVTDDGDCFS